jgi:glutathione S-transferase
MYLGRLEESFSILDKFLEGQTWVAGNNITIADYAIIATVSSIEVRPLHDSFGSLYRLHVCIANWEFTAARPHISCPKLSNYFN